MILPEIFLFSLAAIALTTFGFMMNQRKLKRRKRARYINGLTWLKILRTLLSSIQQHRGLTMGHIRGDSSLVCKIASVKLHIYQQMNKINQQQGWITDNQIWPGITDHWQRIANNYTTYDSHYNFNQHSNMITNLLHLIEECAEDHHLQELKCNDNECASVLWKKFLSSAEHIGQARAVGISIAAAKTSTSIERIKLNHLESCIKQSLLANEQTFDVSLIKSLIKVINKQVVIDKPSISAEAYFNLATQGIEMLLEQFDEYVERLYERTCAT